MPTIRLAETDDQIRACYDCLAELRPHVARDEFIPRVRRQQRSGFHLAYLESGGRVAAAAGYRLGECLAWGKYLYVYDLVTVAAARSQGFGHEMLAWLEEAARAAGCDELHLDSGVQRFDAHRFYLRERMNITSHHFARDLRK